MYPNQHYKVTLGTMWRKETVGELLFLKHGLICEHSKSASIKQAVQYKTGTQFRQVSFILVQGSKARSGKGQLASSISEKQHDQQQFHMLI
uniref:Uncharacterized protein n=1 Tax=Arundo donax TaxID=35708 RepID=A0A0A9DP96_ARUDO